MTNNVELKAIRSARGVADAAIVSSRAIPNPTVKLEWLHANAATSEMGWGVGLAWEPPHPVERSARKGQAEAIRRGVDEEIAEAENELAASIHNACVAADELDEQRKVVEKSIELRERILKSLQERLTQGAATRIEVNMASLSLVRAHQERDTIVLRRQTVLRGLTALAGLPAGQTIGLEPTQQQDDVGPVPEVAGLEQRAMRQSPQLRADAARAEAAEQQLRAERTRQYPWISFSALPRYRHNYSSSNVNDLSFGIDISFPIFDSNRGGIAEAEAERGKQATARAAHEAHIRRDVALALAEMQGRRELLVRFKSTMEPVFREHQTMMQMVLANHQVDIVALLTAEDSIVRSQIELSELRQAYRNAQIQLNRALGNRR